MPTQLDRALNSKVSLQLHSFVVTCPELYFHQNLFFGFAGLVSAAAVWSIFGSDIFPQQPDPTGGEHELSVPSRPYAKHDVEPEGWTDDEMRRWLNRVGSCYKHQSDQKLTSLQRNLMAGSSATREELLARVKANMRAPL